MKSPCCNLELKTISKQRNDYHDDRFEQCPCGKQYHTRSYFMTTLNAIANALEKAKLGIEKPSNDAKK